MKKPSPILKHLKDIEKHTKSDGLNLLDLVSFFGEDGHFVFILFLIIPFVQPVPLFGLSTPFGLFIAVAAGFYALQKPPYVPKRWQTHSWCTKKLNKEIVLKIIIGAEKVFLFLEKYLRPRFAFVFKNIFQSLNIFLIIIHAMLLALPLPIPFSNSIPAWVILLQALAHLEKDGLLVLISYGLSIVSVIFFSGLFFGALQGWHWIVGS